MTLLKRMLVAALCLVAAMQTVNAENKDKAEHQECREIWTDVLYKMA